MDEQQARQEQYQQDDYEPKFDQTDLNVCAAVGALVGLFVGYKLGRRKSCKYPIPLLHKDLITHMLKTKEAFVFDTEVGTFMLGQLAD